MSNTPRLVRTIVHLRPRQVYYQLRKRVIKPRFQFVAAPSGQRQGLAVGCIPKPVCLRGDTFEFLNLSAPFQAWSQMSFGPLWCYNLNYMDWLGQEDMTEEEGARWIDRFIADLPIVGFGLDPYPTALRCINWIKFFLRFPGAVTPEREHYLYSQIKLLERSLEYHLLANHLLEDAFALYFGAAYFCDEDLLKKAEQLLVSELKEQILPDGAHFEQSPMYHCILLDRLLDCCNIRPTAFLEETASRMLGHLDAIVWNDGTVPLLNDAAYGIAPTPCQLFDYARRLGINWAKLPLKDCGYRKMEDNGMEAILDVGEITASYQPGHTHADLFSYVLRIDGKDAVVDTGISTYDKTPRRQYERSTPAHNTVSVEGKDSFEVWGGFRVGKRAKVTLEADEERFVKALHNGFGPALHRRSFSMKEGAFVVEDAVSAAVSACSFIHLAPGVQATLVGTDTIDCGTFLIRVSDADQVRLKEEKVSVEYNRFQDIQVVEMDFSWTLSYSISKK